MTGAVAVRDLLVAGVVVMLLAVFAEPLVERRRERRFAAGLEAARHEADVRAARALLLRDHAQGALDAAYQLAEEQAAVRAEIGQGWSMPSREQVAAAASDGAHDRLDPAAVADFQATFQVIAAALTEEAER